MKRQVIYSLTDCDALEARVATAAERATDQLHVLLSSGRGLAALAALKFTTAGCDPLDPERPLNLVEQLNQSFTYLASIAGARWLLEKHPGSAPYVLNLGTTSGTDIVSEDGTVAAETFAATDPESNEKLRKDLAKVAAAPATHKYVFFLSPVSARRSAPAGVEIVHLEHAAVTRPGRHGDA